MEATSEPGPGPDPEEQPPLGSWGRMYAAVFVDLALVLALIAAFSAFPY